MIYQREIKIGRRTPLLQTIHHKMKEILGFGRHGNVALRFNCVGEILAIELFDIRANDHRELLYEVKIDKSYPDLGAVNCIVRTFQSGGFRNKLTPEERKSLPSNIKLTDFIGDLRFDISGTSLSEKVLVIIYVDNEQSEFVRRKAARFLVLDLVDLAQYIRAGIPAEWFSESTSPSPQQDSTKTGTSN